MGRRTEVIHGVSLAIGTGQLGEPHRTHGEDPKKGGNTRIQACGSVSMANYFVPYHVALGILFFFFPSNPALTWDSNSLTRDRTYASCSGNLGPNCWTTREAPLYLIFSIYFTHFLIQKHPNTRESRKYHKFQFPYPPAPTHHPAGWLFLLRLGVK